MSSHIRYKITPAFPEAHLFTVEISIESPDPGGVVMALPAWIPGSYMIRDFARHIVTSEALVAGKPVPIEKLDKQTWHVASAGSPLIVRYQVYAWDLSVRSAHLDTTHGFFNGTSVFLRVVGKEGHPVELLIEPPPGNREPARGRLRLPTSAPGRRLEERSIGAALHAGVWPGPRASRPCFSAVRCSHSPAGQRR